MRRCVPYVLLAAAWWHSRCKVSPYVIKYLAVCKVVSCYFVPVVHGMHAKEQLTLVRTLAPQHPLMTAPRGSCQPPCDRRSDPEACDGAYLRQTPSPLLSRDDRELASNVRVLAAVQASEDCTVLSASAGAFPTSVYGPVQLSASSQYFRVSGRSGQSVRCLVCPVSGVPRVTQCTKMSILVVATAAFRVGGGNKVVGGEGGIQKALDRKSVV